MNKIFSILTVAALTLCPLQKAVAQTDNQPKADTITVSELRYLGPFLCEAPYMTDETDAAGKKYDAQEAALGQSVNIDALKKASVTRDLPVKSDVLQSHMAGFAIETQSFAKASLIYEGPQRHKLYLDGKPVAGELTMEPGSHFVAVNYLTDTTACDGLNIRLATSSDIKTGTDQGRIFSLDLNTQGVNAGRAELSPSGKYYSLSYNFIRENGDRDQYAEIHETSSGKLLCRLGQSVSWMPSSDRYYITENTLGGKKLVAVDPVSQNKETLAEGIPDGFFGIAPTEDYAVFSLQTEGPKEGDVHQILTPDDRQPGWRNRSYIARYDFATGQMRRLTFGYRNSWPNDISRDGRYLLFATDGYNLSKRPTTVMSLLRMDMQTMAVDTLVKDDGFIGNAVFNSDGGKVAVIGSPEAFGGIGQVLPEGRIANMYDHQLFVLDVATKEVKPLTKDFAPSVESIDWSASDGKIYFTAEDKDCVSLFRIDPETAKAEKLDSQEDRVASFSVSQKTPQLIYTGQSLCTADRVWLLNSKKGKTRLFLISVPRSLTGFGWEKAEVMNSPAAAAI